MKILIVIFFLFFSPFIIADDSFPTAGNSWKINGEFFLSYSEENVTLILSPGLQYFVFNGLGIGVQVSYITEFSTDYATSLNLFTSYYFNSNKDSVLLPFISAGYKYYSDEHLNKHSLMIGGGIAFLISKYFSVDIGIKYYFKQKYNYFEEDLMFWE
ncbi:MAG: transporter, partial [Spirochaetes bacterium]|nr:transporter [Spirochaetota bacterium]